MTVLLLLIHCATVFANDGVVEKIEETRATISEAEKKQRETLSHLFVINKKIKDIAKTRSQLSNRLITRDGKVRELAQEVASLEERSEWQKVQLNNRLRHLYQERKVPVLQWIFSAKSPIELEKHHRFMRKMVDSDHQQLRGYLAHIKSLRSKREELKAMVAGLVKMQREVEGQERELATQMREKSKLVSELKKSKDVKLSELRDLREHTPNADLSYAFFERKGNLSAPVQARVTREYGTYVDPQYRFRLMHKGQFYGGPRGMNVRAVAEGRVALATSLPGYGKTVIIDHGDSYFSVYAMNMELKVSEGRKVREGDLVAVSGVSSPLFGPGVYFEIRHFTDAIDPRHWIKESVIKTANYEELQ